MQRLQVYPLLGLVCNSAAKYVAGPFLQLALLFSDLVCVNVILLR